MVILGIESSTLTASAAVVKDGAVLAADDVPAPTHSDVLLVTIDRVMRQAGVAPAALGAVAVGAGPGSFTGLRIGMSTAKGIAFAAGTPLYAISSLAALAWDAARAGVEGLIVPAMDARRGELYAGFYRADGTQAAPDRVIAPAELAAAIDALRADGPATVVGDGLAAHAMSFTAPVVARPDLRATPSAIAVAQLAARGGYPDALLDGAPRYIRPAEAEILYPDGVPGALRKR
jgi:tRNA threonylcarbamoyladenosine biosynthesis protein TsaB